MPAPIELVPGDRLTRLTLNDPDRRNALGTAMFDALDEALETVEASGAHVLLLAGRGRSFCAGFDLSAAAADPAVMAQYVERLGSLLRTVRRLPQAVVAAVQGAAIAGGCALVSACDLVVVGRSARLGYPVHALGVSPAVTLPTLVQSVGPGAARAMVVGGALLDGPGAKRLGLATHLCNDDEVGGAALELARSIAAHGAAAVRATKRWINELDGSLDDTRSAGPTEDSAALARTEEAQLWLGRALAKRKAIRD